MVFPISIKNRIEDQNFQIDEMGLSGSNVYLFDSQVLKVQDDGEEARNEYEIMCWLDGKLPVPHPIAYEQMNDKNYLLMTRISGEMACSEKYMCNPELLTELLADALKALWQIDIKNCPCNWNLRRKLELVRYRIDHGLIDMEHVEPDTFGKNGFASQEELYGWLMEHRPKEELTLSHGDFCLPNIFFEGQRLAGFIDLGRMGLADKWQDIALCYRSLLHNYDGTYNGKKYEGFEPGMLFEKLGIEPDWEKIRYYLLLDELF